MSDKWQQNYPARRYRWPQERRKLSAVKKIKISLEVITHCVPGSRTGQNPVRKTTIAKAITCTKAKPRNRSNCGNSSVNATNPDNVTVHQYNLLRRLKAASSDNNRISIYCIWAITSWHREVSGDLGSANRLGRRRGLLRFPLRRDWESGRRKESKALGANVIAKIVREPLPLYVRVVARIWE